MKPLTQILNLAGFTDTQDYFGNYYYALKPLFTASLYAGSFIGFIEAYSGISFMFWLFLCLGTLFDIAFGTYANLIHLEKPFETEKFFRGLFKSFVVLLMIFLTNFLKLGVETSAITPEFLKVSAIYMVATLHYSVVFLISLYLLLGVSENGEKVGIQACASINKLVRMRIKKIEEIPVEIEEINENTHN